MLYERGYVRKDVMELYRLIDWLLALPKDLDLKYQDQMVALEQHKSMPFITSIERLGREAGREEASRTLVLRLLRKRFGRLKPAVKQAVEALPIRALERLSMALLDFPAVADLEKWLRRAELSALRKR
jgi:hypothetical protein